MPFDPDVERAKQYICLLVFMFIVAIVAVSVHHNDVPVSEVAVTVTR